MAIQARTPKERPRLTLKGGIEKIFKEAELNGRE
jgi:hypothetical protein